MTKTIRLNDTQLVLLSHATQHDAGALLPPALLAAAGRRTRTQELKSLLRRNLIAEREVTRGSEAWRSDGDLSFGLFVTDEGRKAIGVDDEPEDATEAASHATVATPDTRDRRGSKGSFPRTGSKIGQVVALLGQEGATLDEMVAATGWLPHTTRAALTGLRKKGHTIEKTKRGDVTCYRITAES